jgi:DNA-binding response OmpR family regulator
VASILLVEDDPSVREAVGLALEGDGHRVTTAATGDEAIERWRQHRPELILLDVMLPGKDGFDVYVTKPFESRVLLARIKAVLRRQERPAAEPILRFGDLVIDPGGMAVTRRGVDLRLTPTELRLLLEMARRPGQVFTRALLLERVWDYSYLGDSRLVDVCVQRLRGKVEDDPAHPTLVQTVRGVGYKLVPPE